MAFEGDEEGTRVVVESLWDCVPMIGEDMGLSVLSRAGGCL